MCDVVGIGANSVDHVYRLPQFPRPDSPAAKLRITERRISFGGQTATTIATCAAMGLRTKYVGAIGNDRDGAALREELRRLGIDVTGVHVRACDTAYAVILLDAERGERVVLWDRSPDLRLRQEEIDPAAIARSRVIHVDDADEHAALHAAALGREAGIPVTSDIEQVTARTGELVAAVTIPIFAEHALEPLTGERDPERALRRVRQMVRLKPDTTSFRGMVVATLGARGAMLLDGDRVHHEPACVVQTVDTTGAGDVFRGAFIAALLRGDPPAEMLRFANAAAALSCTREGAIASVPTRAEAEALLRTQGA